MNEADLLVVWGASFSNHTGIAPYKPIVQIDHDPASLGRFHPVELPVLGDVGAVAGQLVRSDRCRALVRRPASRGGRAMVDLARREGVAPPRRQGPRGVNAAAVFDAMSRLLPADAVMCVDVGNNTYSFGRYFEVDRQSVLMSGYLGSIGFGFPAAIGAWAAIGNRRRVVAVTGDGGFGQYAMELTTAVAHDMNIVHVLLDNGELGKISKEQRSAELDVWQTGLTNPDFAEFARLCGAGEAGA